MTFHDTRENYDRIAKWLEENDTEVDWDEVMQSPWWVGPADWVPPPKWSMPEPYPRPITQQMVTKLLLAQVKGGLMIPFWFTESGKWLEINELGGEGVEPAAAGAAETGPVSWKNFLQVLTDLTIVNVTLKPITTEERRQLVRMAWIEEELRRRELETNRERVRRQVRGQTSEQITRWGVKRLVRSACHGKEEAIRELERRGVVSRGQIERWREQREALVKRGRERMKKLHEDRQNQTVTNDNNKANKDLTVESGETELEIIRVGPNPRILVCRYREGGEERTVKVRVKEVRKFRKGMRLRMEVPAQDNGEPLEYTGKLPRLAGRW